MPLRKVAGLFHVRFRVRGQDRERERLILAEGHGLDADCVRGIFRTLEADSGAAPGEVELTAVSLMHDVIQLDGPVDHENENAGEARPAGNKTGQKAAQNGKNR